MGDSHFLELFEIINYMNPPIISLFFSMFIVSFNHENMKKSMIYPLKMFKISILLNSLWFYLEESNQLDTACIIYLLVTKLVTFKISPLVHFGNKRQ